MLSKSCSLFIYIALLHIITSCASSGIRIRSKNKGAFLYIYNSKTKKEEKIGTSPMTVSQDRMYNAAGDNDFALLKMSKFGYLPVYIFIPTDWDIEGQVNIDLTKVDAPYFKQLSKKDYIDKMSKIVFDFLKIQSYIESNDLSSAKRALASAEKEYGEIPPLYVLKGNYYMQIQDFSNALLLYRRANKLYPRDENIKKAILFLESKRRGR